MQIGTECSGGNETVLLKSHCGHHSNCQFKWDSREQGLVLGGFAIGYSVPQLVGGFIADRYGGKWVFGCCIFLCSVLNFILPIMTVYYEISAIMVIRVVQGFVQGPMLPAMFSLSAMWLPAPEKNRMMVFILAGEA